MEQTDGAKFKFNWDKYRYFKKIAAHKESSISSPAVIKLSSVDDTDEWHESVLDFILKLKNSGNLKDYNQIAFLFNSVKSDKVVNLARYLESRGINIYSPRSDMFFKRYEIQVIIGCLLLAFPSYVQKLASGGFKYNWDALFGYYEECITFANKELAKDENKSLRAWLREKGKLHSSLNKNTDYAYSGLIYQMFEFDLFKQYLDIDLNTGIVDTRPARNISTLTQIFTKYEYLHRVSVLSGKKIEDDTEKLFNMYLRFLFDGGLSEYEDDAEYAPSGCVSFLTIHQSKGMEFPVVVVGSLSNLPRKSYNDLIKEVEEKYFKRSSYEPYEDIKYFDFWRLYYTAFSRAQDLLVLSCNETKREPSNYFENVYTDLKNYDDEAFNLDEFEFHEVKEVNLKKTYSFTSHISVYNNCSLQYKFFKELGFTPIRVGSTVFGQLVHQTIEDIHRAALRKEEHLINPENITKWFEINYSTLSKNEHIYLGQPQIDAALNQVLRYAGRHDKLWHTVQDAEIEVGLVKPNFILKGAIDLIKGEGETVELIDFKSEKKPDLIKDKDKVEHYKKQLQIYAHLIEEKTGLNVSKMHLYYTGEESGVPTITFPKDKESINTTIQEFDGIVHKIQKKEFCHKSDSQIICSNCDFRFYCKK
jgi:DNA helicase-2/ATP-dependent DNA helicase PcrA